MFEFLKRKKPDLAEVLVNQAIESQSVMYHLFREALECDDRAIRKMELTYFAASLLIFVFLRFSKEPNREQVLDTFARSLLQTCLTSSREQRSLNQVISEYQARFTEYNALLPMLLNPGSSSTGSPATTLLMHAFECVTTTSANEHMVHITLASSFIVEIAVDHIDFIKNKM